MTKSFYLLLFTKHNWKHISTANIFTTASIASLFITDKQWKKPLCLSPDEKKVIYVMKYLSATSKHQLLFCLITWVNLQTSCVKEDRSKRSHTEGFPWWSSGYKSTLQYGGCEFDLWLETAILYAVNQQLETPCTAAKDPVCCSEDLAECYS